MLVELNVENLAIMDRAVVAFGPGFHTLTGETGAGKSLVVDALELVLGERADTSMVRSGALKCMVSAVFDLSHRPEIGRYCADQGIELDSGMLYIQRELAAEGRSQARLAGRLVPLSMLKDVGKRLVDLHGQHDHQSLFHPERHLGYLDRWMGEVAELDQLRQAHENVSALRSRLNALRQGQRDRAQRLDLLTYQVQEIDAVAPKSGEFERLQAELSRMQHADRLREALGHAIDALEASDDSAASRLGHAIRSVNGAIALDQSLEEPGRLLLDSQIALTEAVRALQGHLDGLDADPGSLQEAADRLESLRRLRRKYGDSEDEILAYREKAAEELDMLQEGEGGMESLEAKLADAEIAQRSLCDVVTAKRREAAKSFEAALVSQFSELAMDAARLEVNISDKEPDAAGADMVEFLFSANVGEPPRPLAKIASGGEASRVMLAIKCACTSSEVPTVVFDEVDAGLGGRAANAVANKLAQLAHHTQVIAITHLAQIASKATSHSRVVKEEAHGRTITRLEPLTGEERVEELARMLSGEAKEVALSHARALLSVD